MLLWRDTDKATQSHSYQSVYLLLQLLMQQKGELWAGRGWGGLAEGVPPLLPGQLARPPGSRLAGVWGGGGHSPGLTGHLTKCPTTGSKAELVYLNKMRNFEARPSREPETKFYHVVKVGREEPGAA